MEMMRRDRQGVLLATPTKWIRDDASFPASELGDEECVIDTRRILSPWPKSARGVDCRPVRHGYSSANTDLN